MKDHFQTEADPLATSEADMVAAEDPFLKTEISS